MPFHAGSMISKDFRRDGTETDRREVFRVPGCKAWIRIEPRQKKRVVAAIPRRREACRVRAMRSSAWQAPRPCPCRRSTPASSKGKQADGGQAGHRPGERRSLPTAVLIVPTIDGGKLTPAS